MTAGLYGSVRLGEHDGHQAWLVKCQPQVAMRLRRLFPVARGQGDEIALSTTEENTRDLEWFLQRYPMSVDQPVVMRELARAFDRRRQDALDILGGSWTFPKLHLAVPARHYQEQAAALARTSESLLLGDDVGLGKTASAIATFADPELRPALVVVMPHLARQWKREIERFMPFAYVHIAKRGTPYDTSHRGRAPDVLIVSYWKLDGWRNHLSGRFRTVVFDEVQELRHTATMRYVAAHHAATGARVRLGLSATPIHNYGGEFFNVLGVLAPGALGRREEFLAEWCTAGGGGKPLLKDPRAFGSYLRDAGLFLRRTRADVGRELPQLTTIVQEVESDQVKLAADTRALAELLLSDDAKPFERMRAGGELDMRLRQATGIAKAPYVAALVRMLLEQGPVVLFGWHREVYRIWAEQLAEFEPAWYTGSESPLQKQEARDRFVSGKTKLLVMSLRSGAGVDGLQRVCSQVVIGELDWSPAIHVQCVGRVHRDGQPDPVFAYFPISEDGSDPVIVDVLDLKRQQLEPSLDPDAPLSQAAAVDPQHVQKLAREYLRRHRA